MSIPGIPVDDAPSDTMLRSVLIPANSRLNSAGGVTTKINASAFTFAIHVRNAAPLAGNPNLVMPNACSGNG
ncbi:hypothetical protein RAHE111665_14525 [Rariglobus hedericola]